MPIELSQVNSKTGRKEGRKGRKERKKEGKKKERLTLHKLFHKTKGKKHNSFIEASINLITRARQRHYKKRKLQTSIPHEHRCQNSKNTLWQIEFNNT